MPVEMHMYIYMWQYKTGSICQSNLRLTSTKVILYVKQHVQQSNAATQTCDYMSSKYWIPQCENLTGSFDAKNNTTMKNTKDAHLHE